MPRKKTNRADHFVVRAIRTSQGEGIDLYAFFMPGSAVLKMADISRVHRNKKGSLRGFQRKGIKKHVAAITEYLDRGPAVFPNAIILAVSPEARFVQSRGSRPKGLVNVGQIGTLMLPIPKGDEKLAWIVDGQQRSLALAQAKNKAFPVPVIAFVSPDIAMQREQFILVNKAKPLSPRLVDELLPEVGGEYLPRDLSLRRVPSELCDLLNRKQSSPFFGLIRRPSTPSETAIVNDGALIKTIRSSLNPLGSLAPFGSSSTNGADLEAMFRTLTTYWSAVRDTFPDAWGKPPTESRLMHSAGIEAMGILMDRLMTRSLGHRDQAHFVRNVLKKIKPHCAWTKGHWRDIGREWNEIQYVGKDVRLLADQLTRLEYEATTGALAA